MFSTGKNSISGDCYSAESVSFKLIRIEDNQTVQKEAKGILNGIFLYPVGGLKSKKERMIILTRINIIRNLLSHENNCFVFYFSATHVVYYRGKSG